MTGCSRCGDCCERIHSVPMEQFVAMTAHDPATMNAVGKSNIATAVFAIEHWKVVGVETDALGLVTHNIYACEAFDPVTRLCTAHEARPPVCSGFPWYGKEPYLSKTLHPRCSFNADVRTTLPIAAVNGRSTTCGSSARAEGT